jgi:hypothetical protein
MGLKRKPPGKREERIADDEATIRLHIEPLAEGGYVATSPDVPGLVAEGRSITETVETAGGGRVGEEAIGCPSPLVEPDVQVSRGWRIHGVLCHVCGAWGYNHGMSRQQSRPEAQFDPAPRQYTRELVTQVHLAPRNDEFLSDVRI